MNVPLGNPDRPTGRRKIHPAELVNAKFKLPEGAQPRRGEMLWALKTAAPAYGWPMRLVHFMDHLMGYTHEGDWQHPARPIVWPASRELQEQLGIGRTQLKALVSIAIEAGLMILRESPNGHRYGRRDSRTGRILFAYGFDLTPLAARREEFLASGRAHRERLAEGKLLRQEIARLKNRLLSLLEIPAPALDGRRPDLLREAQVLFLSRRESCDPTYLLPIAEQLRRLDREIVGQIEAASAEKPVNSDPLGSENRPHIQSTYDLDIAKANTNPAKPPVAPPAGQEKLQRGKERQQRDTCWGSSAGSLQPTPLMVVRLSPSFRSWIRNPRPGWSDILEAAGLVRAELGISQDAWGDACLGLGRIQAALALAAISARHAFGEVQSPGGILRAMTKAQARGELRLDRTIASLLRRGLPPGRENMHSSYRRSSGLDQAVIRHAR